MSEENIELSVRKRPPKETDEDFYSSCVEFIRANINQKGLVQKLAQYMFLSERQVRRRLASYCGKTAGELTDEIRCEKIKELLLTRA